MHGRYYGSRHTDVRKLLDSGCDVLLNIDVQGAAAFRSKAEEDPCLAGRLVTIFLQPESLEQIRHRMELRGTDDAMEIERRLRSAEAEMQHAPQFDYRIISSSRDADFTQLKTLYHSLKK